MGITIQRFAQSTQATSLGYVSTANLLIPTIVKRRARPNRQIVATKKRAILLTLPLRKRGRGSNGCWSSGVRRRKSRLRQIRAMKKSGSSLMTGRIQMIMRASRQAVISALAVVTCLTVAFALVQSSVLFYSLFPGLAAGLRITGGHGGSKLQETIAPVVSFVVNWIIYSTALAALLFARLSLSGDDRSARY